jgi:hypothetical protein
MTALYTISLSRASIVTVAYSRLRLSAEDSESGLGSHNVFEAFPRDAEHRSIRGEPHTDAKKAIDAAYSELR